MLNVSIIIMRRVILSIQIGVVLFIIQSNALYSQDDSLLFFRSQLRQNRGVDSNKVEYYKGKILSIAKTSKNEKTLFYVNTSLGNTNRYEGNYDKALGFYFKALEYSKASNSQMDVASIYDNLARIYLNIGEIGLMFESINKSLVINNEKDNELGVNLTKQILLSYYRNIGNYSEVLRIAFTSLQYYLSINDSLQIANTYNSIGVTYKNLENYEKSLSYYNLSDAYYKHLLDKRGVSTILNNKGTVLLNLKKYQDALANFQKSIEIEKGLGRVEELLTRYNNMGLAYAYLGNFKPALYYLNLCKVKYEKSGNLLKLANTFESLARFYDLKGVDDSLEYYLVKSYKLCGIVNSKSLKAKVAFRLSELYRSKNDLAKAYDYLKKYKEVDDSLYHSKSFFQITEEEYRYLQTKDYEIQKVEKHNILQRYVIIIGFLTILILVFWILLLIQRGKVKANESIKKSLEKTIDIQNDELIVQGKELVTKTLQLGNDSSEVKYAIQQLKTLQSEFGVQGKHKIQQLILDLEHNQNKDIWSEFELRFSKVNKNFYDILLSLFPTLTISERRLAALIFLNFSTKEISTITKQTPRSVLVAKSRLRKKMNLPPSKDISNYLNELLPS